MADYEVYCARWKKIENTTVGRGSLLGRPPIWTPDGQIHAVAVPAGDDPVTACGLNANRAGLTQQVVLPYNPDHMGGVRLRCETCAEVVRASRAGDQA